MELKGTLSISESHKEALHTIRRVEEECKKKLFGIDDAIRYATLSIFTAIPRDSGRGKYLGRAHFLFIAPHGRGKTALLNTISHAVSAKHTSASGHPDMMPTDLVGGLKYIEKAGFFKLPSLISANIFRFEEINRTNPKALAALLSAMEEGEILLQEADMENMEIRNVVKKLHPIPNDPSERKRFFQVFASANPIDNSEGVYPLPEAVFDRFTFSSNIPFPSREQEKKIRSKNVIKKKDTEQVTDLKTVLQISEHINKEVTFTEETDEYMMRLIENSRPGYVDNFERGLDDYVKDNVSHDLPDTYEESTIKESLGASPRANFHFEAAAKTLAFFRKRKHVTTDDIKDIAPLIMRHRIIRSYSAVAQRISQDRIVQEIINKTRVPGL